MGTIFKNVLLEDDTGGENKASFSCYKVLQAKREILLSAKDGCAAVTDIFGRGDPSPTAVIHFSFVGEAFRLPLFDLHHCSVSRRKCGGDRYFDFYASNCG